MDTTNLYCLGDLHLSVNNEWRFEIGSRFLDWFEQTQVEKDSYFLCLGDYADEAVNPGEILGQLIRFFNIISSKFKHSYLLVGNHDLKLYKNKPTLSIEGANNYPNITILRKPAETVHVGAIKVLSLPYYNHIKNVIPMYDYYNNLPKNILDSEYDLVVGHFASKSSKFPFIGNTVDLSKIKTKHICLGDIHTKVTSDYIGSATVCKISEEDPGISDRAIWQYTKQGNNIYKSEINIPISCKYREIIYPEEMVETHPVTIWSVRKAPSEAEVLRKYPGKFIRACYYDDKEEDTKISSSEDFKINSPLTVFTQWKEEKNIILSRRVSSIIKTLLT